MSERIVEISFNTDRIVDAFFAWLRDEGAENFEDWAHNFLDGVQNIDINFTEDGAIEFVDE